MGETLTYTAEVIGAMYPDKEDIRVGNLAAPKVIIVVRPVLPTLDEAAILGRHFHAGIEIDHFHAIPEDDMTVVRISNLRGDDTEARIDIVSRLITPRLVEIGEHPDHAEDMAKQVFMGKGTGAAIPKTPYIEKD